MAESRKGSVVLSQRPSKGASSGMMEKPIDLDYVLINELGQFGWFQFMNLVLVALPMIMSAFINEYIFSAAAIPHRCRIEECGEEIQGLTYDQEWIPDAIPPSGSGFSSCQRFVPQGGNGTLDFCPAFLFDRSNAVNCDGFVYERENSVVYEFDLGCQDWLRALAGTLNSVGTLLVLPITGYISDRFGRRVALIINVFNLGLFGLVRAFSVNYPMYLALQILQTTLGAGTFSSAYIFATELVGPKYRVVTGAVATTMYSLGQAVLGAVAWAVTPWRALIMVLHIPCFIIIPYYWILSESVRWLLSKKKFTEAKAVLEKVAKVNRTQISEKSLDALLNPPEAPKEENESKESLVKTVINSPVLLRRVCTTPIWWISATFVYFGLSINATGLSDTMYLSYILTVIVEIPGAVVGVFILDGIGRKMTLTSGYFLSSACNIAFAFIPSEQNILRMVIYLLGKFAISVVLMSLYLYTSELYPTRYRHSLLGFSSMIGRIGSITAPLTPVLMNYWKGTPSMMFAIMGLISGLLVLTQPETLGTKLPDTLAEAEALGQPQSRAS